MGACCVRTDGSLDNSRLFWPATTSTESDGSSIADISDWFGEAVIAAVLSSMIPVLGMGWMHLSDDPLTADLVEIQPDMFGIAMIPIALMIIRRGAVWALRRLR